jgi:hypothetical protein
MNIIQYGRWKEPQKKERKTNLDAKECDKKVKYCTKCQLCWQIDYTSRGGSRKAVVIHYEDFVTYGKERELCLSCR